MSRATITDVAEHAGVSKSTVSAVMNDSRPVSKSTRKKVMEAVEALNYRPRSSAQQGTKANRSIGLVIKERSNPFYAEIAEGVAQHTRDAGYTLYTASSEGDFAMETEIIDDMRKRDVDGLIIYPVINGDTDLTNLLELRRARTPFVLMEQIVGVQASTVDVSLLAASKKAVAHLLDGGHRNVVHFAGPSYSVHSDERITGMRHAFSESEIAYSGAMVIPTGARMEDGYRVALEYFRDCDTETRPTAATCFNDVVALGVFRALRELGLDVPGDVSLVGCDGIDWLDYHPVPLTTIRSPSREMGESAARILVDRIEGEESDSVTRKRFEPELLVRASTRPLSPPHAAG